jgi:NADH:ubiquinone oxidoreductase subunit K
LSALAIVAASCICSLGFALVVLLWRRTGRADVDALGDLER